MADIDLPDVNVWLALSCPDHLHHPAARDYWRREAAPRLAFCRITMLGLLRLATNSAVMRGAPFTPRRAWKIYRDFLVLPEILFLAESSDLEIRLAALSDGAEFSPRHWTDAYLAAFAQGAGCRLVSFDSDFRRFPELDLLHLPSG